MRLAYMGTPDFAVAPLLALIEAGCDVAVAVTQPDRPRDRGKRVQPPPVKAAAEKLGIPVLQPDAIKGDARFLERLKAAGPDLIVVAAYGRMLPPEILGLPPLGCVNIHASILPKYRGAAPIQRAVMDGAKETGVTLIYMSEDMDAGDIIGARRTDVGRKTSAELFRELSLLGAGLLSDSLPALASGRAPASPQDHASATYAPMVRRQEGRVDFARPPEETERLVRAMNAHPGAYALYEGKAIKIWGAEAAGGRCDQPHGTVAYLSEKGIAVSAGGGILTLTELQAPGGRAMAAPDFARGRRLGAGSVFA
ncbi:MAG: methionyl-tRNA formyltransferase [Clostridiales Family XIII bacterium]|nr:methionyl-tRNA formyltransferase [Clostridiales Family XIII bacterium]